MAVQLLLAVLVLLTLFPSRAAELTCSPYGSTELSMFSKEGDFNIGGIFSFHQNPVAVNPALRENPGNIQCEG